VLIASGLKQSQIPNSKFQIPNSKLQSQNATHS
jgi:hypothetical protein